MVTETLKEKCNRLRSAYDFVLPKKSYIIAMVDGKNFSKLIKKKFKLPFDERFIHYMNETAKYLCEHIQGARFAFTQSDEISILITDVDNPLSDTFYGNRLCKMQSVIASMATAKFNQLMTMDLVNTPCSNGDLLDMFTKQPICLFDCKTFSVPSKNDVYAWFLFRHNDCVRNSKQQAARTYLSHKQVLNLNTSEQTELLKKEKGIDWNLFNNGEKYGRIVSKKLVTFTVDSGATVTREKFMVSNCEPFQNEEFSDFIENLIPEKYENEEE